QGTGPVSGGPADPQVEVVPHPRLVRGQVEQRLPHGRRWGEVVALEAPDVTLHQQRDRWLGAPAVDQLVAVPVRHARAAGGVRPSRGSRVWVGSVIESR